MEDVKVTSIRIVSVMPPPSAPPTSIPDVLYALNESYVPSPIDTMLCPDGPLSYISRAFLEHHTGAVTLDPFTLAVRGYLLVLTWMGVCVTTLSLVVLEDPRLTWDLGLVQDWMELTKVIDRTQ